MSDQETIRLIARLSSALQRVSNEADRFRRLSERYGVVDTDGAIGCIDGIYDIAQKVLQEES